MYEAVSYEGEPEESEEMRPKWFGVTELPLKVRFRRPPFRRSIYRFAGGKDVEVSKHEP